jgi:hypothetical protein
MNPPIISAPRDVARTKADAYRAQLRKRHDPEYAAAAEAYQLLADGHKLLDIGVAIREGGYDEKMRPRLALARADRRQVYFEWGRYSTTGVYNTNASERWGQQHATLIERINFNRRHGLADAVSGFALVPMIPADVRPAGNATRWHILWEVDAWSDTRIGPRPPTDPYLLRRVRGDLFVVLAEWNLTELEKYVMASRAHVTS